MNKTINRTHRISEVLQRELARVLLRDFKDHRIGLVTIVGVEVSKDLAHAKIFITIFEREGLRNPSSLEDGEQSIKNGPDLYRRRGSERKRGALQQDNINQTIEILNEASGFFRSLIAKNMNMRVTPRPRFIYDDSVVRGHRLNNLIEQAVS